MTAQILAAELTTLIQDTKRKNTDIRSAAEKSLADLKALPNTSEGQLAADLKRRPKFVRPLLLACASKNAKFAATAISSLQRLVQINGLALEEETLKDTLEVIRECTGLPQDIQLKILQIIPSLLQNYGSHIQKDLLVVVVHICFILLASKTAVISNTAAATLQQLVVGVLGKVVKEDEGSKTQDFVAEVPIENGSISVMPSALDAYRLFDDICLLLEGDRPAFLHPTSMSPTLGMELVEAMMATHPVTMASHPELVHILRSRLLPFVISVISGGKSFPITVRAMRLLPIIFGNMLSALPSECEVLLGLLTNTLEDNSTQWKRVLCMEIFRSIHSDPHLIRSIYAHFDEQEGKRNVVKDHLAILVRLSGEKPTLIGLGPHSTIPASSGQTEEEIDEMAAMQVDGIGGSVGVAMTLRSSTAPGISARLSTMRVPCLEQLDKSEPPQIPPAYLYTLVLTCMNSFSENLARFLLPFTIPGDARNRRKLKPEGTESPRSGTPDVEQAETEKAQHQRTVSAGPPRTPLNPLSLESHPKYQQIKTSAKMIENCWPALLATYSTFFHAALDSEYYHALVRSFQKFTQVAGLLRLATPRDAFLTALGKNAVPSSVVVVQPAGQTLPAPEIHHGRRGSKTPIPNTPAYDTRQEPILASLNTRNLLCLRALLNLGIALGPVLQAAWSIILETLQQADLIIDHVSTQRRHSRTSSISAPTATPSDVDLLGDISNEIGAVRIAATRMFESSADLPDEAFLDVVASMSSLLRNLTDSDPPPETSKSTSGPQGQSIPTTALGNSQDPRANVFVVENLEKIAEANKFRFLEQNTQSNGWHIFVNSLLGIVTAQHFEPEVRLRAAQALDRLVAITAQSDIAPETKDEMRQEGLVAISRQIEALHRKQRRQKPTKSCELDIHFMSLETLRALLEQFGDSLISGWSEVFSIITSVFEDSPLYPEAKNPESQSIPVRSVTSKSPKLTRSSFGSLQLICSDFLPAVPQECMTILLSAIHSFCLQQDDFNISLTSSSLFCNVADHLWQGEESLHLHAFNEDRQPDPSSIEIQNFDNVKAEMLLRLLLLLVEVTVDERLEIRHGAIHSVFRILDACGEKLDSQDWIVCLHQVVLNLFNHNQTAYVSAKDNAKTDDDMARLLSWNEAAIVLMDNSATLLGTNINLISTQKSFTLVWSKFVDHLRALLNRKNLDVSATVYSTLEKILVEIEENNRSRFNDCSNITWKLWEADNPSKHSAPGKRNLSNQAALTAYLHCLSALQPLLAQNLKPGHIKVILQQMQSCAVESSPTAYSDDTETPTPLQAQIVHHISSIDDSIQGSISEIIRTTAFFTTLAFESDHDGIAKGGPTFLAMSKASMDLLSSFITKHALVAQIYTDGSFLAALEALSMPISLKYKWRAETKLPTTWQKSTTTAINILSATIPSHLQATVDTSEHTEIWSRILAIVTGVMSADKALLERPSQEAPEDQDFDITSFERLYSLIVPILGSSTIHDKLRRGFARALFQNSLIHEPHPDDLPEMDSREILANLSSTHIGRTNDLKPSRRSRIAYICFDKLADLVALHDGSPERITLAQAVAPYLILRAGIVLKAYILNQPLRGRMPMPASQRKELLYVLRACVHLVSEPKAIPDAPGVKSQEKKHLYRIYGLVNRALRVSRGDLIVYNALMRVVEVCAMDFGID